MIIIIIIIIGTCHITWSLNSILCGTVITASFSLLQRGSCWAFKLKLNPACQPPDDTKWSLQRRELYPYCLSTFNNMEITCWENSTLSVFPQIGCNVLVMDLKKGRDISNFQLFQFFNFFGICLAYPKLVLQGCH